MFRYRWCIVLIALGFTQVHSVMGDVVAGDDAVFGAGALTLDTDQGLEFLDLDRTTGRSVDRIMTEFGAGGDFEGFRRASADQVLRMIGNAGFQAPNLGMTVAIAPDPAFAQFVTMTSVVGNFGGIRISRGTVVDEPVAGRSYMVALEDYINLSSNDFITAAISASHFDVSGSIGHWLVRDSVPAPGWVGVLMVSGLAVGVRRR